MMKINMLITNVGRDDGKIMHIYPMIGKESLEYSFCYEHKNWTWYNSENESCHEQYFKHGYYQSKITSNKYPICAKCWAVYEIQKRTKS